MGYLESVERIKVPENRPKRVKKPWLKAWQELAHLTHGIGPEDARLTPVLEALDQCNIAFYADNWPVFEVAAARVRTRVNGGKG